MQDQSLHISNMSVWTGIEHGLTGLFLLLTVDGTAVISLPDGIARLKILHVKQNGT